jgi:tripartite-type tricarboxylate transporter receptor subunit TctC
MIKKLLTTATVVSAIAALNIAASPAALAAESVAEFYKGKRITILVGSRAGGGYDIYARTVANNISKYIPGNPSVIVQNKPGAGSMIATNAAYSTRAQDGTVIVAMQAGALFEQIMGNPQAKFTATKFQWLANLNTQTGIAITWHKSKVKNFDDLLKHQATFGTSGPNTTEQNSSLLINLFGAKIKQIPGYRSVTSMYKPLEQGEIDGMTTLWQGIPARFPRWIKNKRLNYIVFMASKRTPDLPNVPLIGDFLTPKYLKSGMTKKDALKIINFISSQQKIARPYAFGPGVPADRVAALRQAFNELGMDQKYLNEAKKAKRPVDLTPGVDVQKLLGTAASSPQALIKRIAKLTKLVKQ